MKYWPILWGNLKRRKARTLFTLLSILIAFVLFAYLAAVKVAFRAGVDVAGADRLFTTQKTAIILPLPKKYQEQIAAVPGVKAVTHMSWFGGIYQNPNKGFQGVFQAPVDPEPYLEMYPEILVPAEQKAAWLADRQGVVVGRKTAERYGWKVGDRVPVQGTIYRKKDGSSLWNSISSAFTTAKRRAPTRRSSSSATTTSTRPANTARGSSAGSSCGSTIRSRRRWSARRSTRCSRTRRTRPRR